MSWWYVVPSLGLNDHCSTLLSKAWFTIHVNRWQGVPQRATLSLLQRESHAVTPHRAARYVHCEPGLTYCMTMYVLTTTYHCKVWDVTHENPQVVLLYISVVQSIEDVAGVCVSKERGDHRVHVFFPRPVRRWGTPRHNRLCGVCVEYVQSVLRVWSVWTLHVSAWSVECVDSVSAWSGWTLWVRGVCGLCDCGKWVDSVSAWSVWRTVGRGDSDGRGRKELGERVHRHIHINL